MIAAAVGKMEESYMTAVFINGLEEKIRAELNMLNPIRLKETMLAAARIERKNDILSPKPIARHQKELPSNPTKNENRTIPWTPTKITSSSPAQTSQAVTTASSSKAPTQTINHNSSTRCKNKELHVLMVSEEIERTKEEISIQGDVQDCLVLEGVELSSTFGIGMGSVRTLKVRGLLGQTEVVVLIDCGATHNFVSRNVVEKLWLPISGTADYVVTIGNGERLQGYGICRNVELRLPELTIIEDFLPLPIRSVDVILGLKWLSTVGETRDDWKQMTMTFEFGGKQIVLRGDPSLTRALVSFKSISRAAKKQGEGLLLELYQVITTDEGQVEVAPELMNVLKEFGEVFNTPTELPPERG